MEFLFHYIEFLLQANCFTRGLMYDLVKIFEFIEKDN